jgi:hypothetical protein
MGGGNTKTGIGEFREFREGNFFFASFAQFADKMSGRCALRVFGLSEKRHFPARRADSPPFWWI